MSRAQILVADGDPGFAGGLVANLESLGYAVTEVVSSPEAALQKAEETRPDLVLLDLGMLRDGKQGKAARELRKRFPQELLYLVADEERENLRQAKISHSFEYLRKAYDSRELKTIVDMALHRQMLERQLRQVKESCEAASERADLVLQRANRALKTLSAVNQAIVRAQTEAALLENVCRAVIQEGGYRLAWIGYAENDRGKTVRPVAQAGYEEGYLETLKVTWADTERGRGPTGTVIRTGQPAAARNILTDPHFAPWRQEAVKRGYASSLVLPLMVEDTAFGALNIYAGEADAFDAAEVQLLTDLAADVSFGILALRTREERRRMAAALRRSYEEMEARVQDRTQELARSNAALQNEIAERLWSEKKLQESEVRYRSLVDLSPDAIAVQSQGRYLFINPAGARLFGATDPGDLVGKAVSEVTHPDYRRLVSERICQFNTEGVKTELQEIKIVRLDGRVVDVEASGVGITYQGQPAVQVMLRNITVRKEMERRLEHLASFPRLNPHPILEVDTTGTITYYNAGALEALEKLKMAPGEVKAFLPSDLDAILKTARETGESTFHREVQINGAFFSELISFAREFKVIRIYARDITARKRAELERQELLEKLQASEEELQATVEELQVQTQELQSQSEELKAQAEELQTVNQNLNQIHTALTVSNQRLALLAETAGRLLAQESPLEVVESLCRKVMDVLNLEVCFNFLLDEQAGRLHLHTCVGISDEEARQIEWLDPGTGLCGCGSHEGCRIVAEDIQITPDGRTELIRAYGVQAYACQPLLARGRVLGTLAFGSRRRSRFTNEELEMMSAVADQVAIALDRKQAEEALRESQKDLNRAQAVALTGNWRMNVQKNELLWSDENHRIFGIPQGTPMTYETFLATVHPDDLEYVDRKWMAALRGEPYDIEHRIVVGDTVKWVRELAELEFDPQGRLQGGFGTTQDITARKGTEEALKESEARYRSLFQNNHAVMLLIDPQTTEIVDANPAACSFYGYRQDELTSKKITDLNLAPREQVLENMSQVEEGKARHFFFKHRLASGEVRDVEIYSSPLKVRDRLLLYSIIHDNTARKEAEDTLQASRLFLEIANRHTRLTPLLQDFAASLKENTGCEAVAIRILDDQGRIPYEAYEGFPPEFIACESLLSIHSDQCLCINVCKGAVDLDLPCYTPGSSCYINQFSHLLATTPPARLGETRNICHQFGYESLALIPIVFGGRILGLIHLADHRVNMMPLSQVQRLERIALTLGTAINRVRAEEGLRQALADSRQRQGEIAALLQATRAVLQAGNFQEIARSIYDSCKELIGASSGYIALLTPDGLANEVLFLDTGKTDCTVDPSLPMPVRGLRAEACQTGKTVYDNDYPKSSHAQFLPPGHVALDNVLFAPMGARGRTMGLLGLGNKPGGYNDNDARLAAGFAELAAMALANHRAEVERQRLIKELEQERARLQAIIESAPEAIVVADENGLVVLTNPAADQLYSHPDGCVPDAPSCALFQFCEADGTMCVPGDQPLLRSAKEGETHRNLEMILAWPDGRRRDLLVNTAPIRDQQGRSGGAVGLFQDITSLKESEKERQRLLQELEEQRTLLEAVLHQMPAGLAIVSAAGKLILANEQVEQIFGQQIPPGIDLDQITDFKVFHPDGRPYRLEEYPLARALGPGETIIDEDIDFQRGDGTRGIIRCSAAPIRDGHGDILAGVVTFYDITERKQAELDLARRTAEFEAIFNSITDAVVFTDTQRRVVMVNPAMASIFGYALEDLYGKSTEFLYARKADHQEQGRKRYHTGAVFDHNIFQVPYRRKDGTVFIGETLGTQVRDASGLVVGFVGIHRDITQRKEAEEKIQKLNQELGGRIREVSERTLQLEAANKELEAFSYSVSHDLRTPLRAIEGFSRMLLEDHVDKLAPEGLRLLEVIRSNTQIMGELIDDLLALSRLGRQEIRPQKIDLGGLVVSVFGDLKNQARSRQMDLILNPLPPVLGDRSLLNQVLVNLLGNAVKFTKSRDQAIIEVGGWTEGKENIYFVKDNGVGFDMRYVDKMFGVFQRLHRREDFEGTGVGLAIVQRIISRHGGRVWAAGKVDSGAVFYFALPQTGEES
jgi:PAS domain S-box-containing protein